MTDHLQTTLNCGAEPITLAQHVSVSVLVVINQGSLRHDDVIFLYDYVLPYFN